MKRLTHEFISDKFKLPLLYYFINLKSNKFLFKKSRSITTTFTNYQLLITSYWLLVTGYYFVVSTISPFLALVATERIPQLAPRLVAYI